MNLRLREVFHKIYELILIMDDCLVVQNQWILLVAIFMAYYQVFSVILCKVLKKNTQVCIPDVA